MGKSCGPTLVGLDAFKIDIHIFHVVLTDSTITYTTVSSPFEGLSDIGSLGVDGPPVMPEDLYAYVAAAFQAPPSPVYVPGPKEPEQASLSPEFIPEPVYLVFIPPEDEVFPAEEQPLPAAVSPTFELLGYIADFDPEEDPEEDPIDYPTDGGDDDDDDDESSDDDEDDDDDVDEDEDDEVEEEHLAPADSVPPPVHLSSLVPVSPPPLPASPTYLLGFRAAMIQKRAKSPSTSHSLPLPPPIILSHTRASVAMMRAAASIHTSFLRCLRSVRLIAPTARPTRGFRADYGFVATLDDEIRHDPERCESTEDYRIGIVDEDCSLASSRSCSTCTAYGDTKTDEYTADIGICCIGTVSCSFSRFCREWLDLCMYVIEFIMNELSKMAPKRTIRANPADTTATYSVTNAQLKAMIDQGVIDALVARDADRNTNGDDNHNSRTGVRRT
ncbi:hypothetical protein Tco_1120556 [Tanacetum coccineum]